MRIGNWIERKETQRRYESFADLLAMSSRRKEPSVVVSLRLLSRGWPASIVHVGRIAPDTARVVVSSLVLRCRLWALGGFRVAPDNAMPVVSSAQGGYVHGAQLSDAGPSRDYLPGPEYAGHPELDSHMQQAYLRQSSWKLQAGVLGACRWRSMFCCLFALLLLSLLDV